MSPADLARRAVACRGWRWMPGMRYRLSPRHPWCRYEGGDATDDDGNPVTESPPAARSALAVPDLSDPATQGCVIALLDEAYGDWWVEPSPGADMRTTRWAVYVWNGSLTRRMAVGATRIEALIAALEAKP